MTSRITKSIILISSIAILLTMLLTTMMGNSYSKERTTSGLMQEARLIASSVEMNGIDYLEKTDFGKKSRVTWIADDGSVLFDSTQDEEQLENHSDREEFREAVENGEGSAVRYSGTLMHSTLNYAVRLDDGSVIRVSGMHMSLLAQMMNLTGTMVMILIAVALISVIAARKVSRKIVRPINSIDLEHPKTESGYRELVPLLDKLNTQNIKVRRQMDELQQNRRQFELIVGSMSEGIIIADQKLNVISNNEASLKLLGIDEFNIGQSIYSMNNSDIFRHCVLNALGGIRTECVLEMADRQCEIIASPARRIDMVCGIVVFIMDVTEKYKLDIMRREFTANVSHELKTPLTTIYGISDMLAENMVQPQDIPQFSENIRSETERLISLVNDTIALSKLDEGMIFGEISDVDLYSLAVETVSRLEITAAEKNISMNVSGEHITVRASRNMLNDILYNLCDNAIKYGKDGGSADISLTKSKKGAVLKVSDNGIGIPKDKTDRIFERFFRVDKSRSGKVRGTGLGLSIVKHSVMQLGGSISVESRLGEGTAFTVEIPCE
ncbi:MAG: ATP-binding protein [Ruminococcus sp.]|nr:ATP-binding protein [Ruminococcus sp.]